MVNRPDLVTVFMEVTWNLYQKDRERLVVFWRFFFGGEGGRDCSPHPAGGLFRLKLFWGFHIFGRKQQKCLNFYHMGRLYIYLHENHRNQPFM